MRYELNMKFPRDIEWMEKKVSKKTGMVRMFGYGGILLYAVIRGVVLVIGMMILLPLLWLKEKTI